MKRQAKPMLGGLNTKLPPTMLDPQFSPDLYNVVVRDGVVRKRGGLIPLFRDRMLGDSLENVSYKAQAALADSGAGASTDGDFVISTGCMLAGHRDIYNQGDGEVDIALWFTPTRMISQQGGNALGTAGAFNPAPYVVQVLPIISKGPVRKSQSYLASWIANPAQQWGAASDAGMQFCVYLFNSGTGTVPVWSLRLSSHVKIAGSWTLQTVVSTMPISEGYRYHILAQVSTTRVALRVARMHGEVSSPYVEDETIFAAGTIGRSKCPVQVFDCPQQFVQTTAVGSATQRPGLGITSGASGGYWFSTLRPDGFVDQIAVWTANPTLPTLESLERVVRVDAVGQVGLANLWSMGGDSLDYVREDTGRGNHLYLCPRGPISVPDDGGKEGGSWFLNGTTSYILLNTETPNWRFYDATAQKPATMYSLVRDNMAHGIHVEVWPESIETVNGQVLAEIHGVLRLEIKPDGAIQGYCRAGSVSATATTATEMGMVYQGPVTSITTVEPGRRYAIALLRLDGGATLQLFIDGKMEASIAVVESNYATTPVTGNSHPPGGVTIGAGSFERLLRGATPTDPDMAGSTQINTDCSTGFVGRVETFRIITTDTAVELVKRNGPESFDDWRFSESRVWANPVGGNRSLLFPDDENDTVRSVGRGAIPRLATQEEDGFPVSSTVSSNGGASGYALSQNTMLTSIANDQYGHEQLSAVGARIYHTLCYYRFNIEDKELEYGGAYILGFEKRYLSSAVVTDPTFDSNPIKHTHLQESQVVDQLGLLSSCWRCCSETDIMSELAANLASGVASQGNSHRQRPYAVRSPKELGFQWRPGLIASPSGKTPVTLLADYDVQIESRRLTVTACGRQIYWAKPAWDRGNLFFAGGDRSYCVSQTNPLNDLNIVTSPSNTIVVSMWVKPIRLDGTRVLASKRLCDAIAVTTGIDTLFNWMIYVDNGAIVVCGVEDGNLFSWRFVEGNIPAGAADVSQSQSLKNGVWNNINVTMVGGTGVTVRVNGEMVQMSDCSTLTGAKQSNPMGTGASPSVGTLYLGGFPEGFTKTVLPNSTGTDYPLSLESWYGQIADFQVRTSVDTNRWDGDDGFPYPMGELDPGAVYALPLDEGSGWLLNNTVDIGFGADINIQEFFAIAGGIRQESGRYYKSVAFRDRLIVTNGADKPQSIQFLGFDKSEAFRVRQVGVDAPVGNEVILQQGTTPGAAINDGLYVIQVAFVTEDGLESEPVELSQFQLSGGPVGTLDFAIINLPRSPDPQVVARRIYVSANGGGAPIFNRDLNDNDSYQVDFSASSATVGEGTTPGEQLPAPRGRHIAIAGTSLVLADLPDIPAGQNAFAFSGTAEISQFTLQGLTVVIDSEDGKPIVGIGHNLGQVFMAKRNSIHMLSVGAIVTAFQVDAAVRLVQASDGIGGAIASASNLLYGAGDRGVFVFDNTQLSYLSDSVEPTWRNTVDRGDLKDGNGLYLMHGAFLRPFTQYWLSVRRRGQTVKDTLLSLDLATGSWSVHSVPDHVVMTILETVTSNPVLAFGTTSGSILYQSDDYISDGVDSSPNAAGAVTIQGAAGLSGSDTDLTMAGANFSTTLAGMRGAVVTITYNGGLVTTRTIIDNDTDTIRWEDAIPGWVSYDSFVVGAYAGYWTSPWMSVGYIGQPQKMARLAVEAIPQPGDLTVDISAILRADAAQRDWPTDPDRIETFTIPMDKGYTDRQIVPREQAEGQYHRVRFGTYGVDDPFALVGYTPEINPSSSRDMPGRTS